MGRAPASFAELHLHLEGSIQPATVCALTRRHGVVFTEAEVREKYAYKDFTGFLEAFKWVTSFVRDPQDFALILNDLGEHLLTQYVVYAEVTLSVGVMILRKQSPEANFEAMIAVAESFAQRGLQLKFIFDAVRQFGAAAAMEVVNAARAFTRQSDIDRRVWNRRRRTRDRYKGLSCCLRQSRWNRIASLNSCRRSRRPR